MFATPYTETAEAARVALKPMSLKCGIHCDWKPVIENPVMVNARASSQKLRVRTASERRRLMLSMEESGLVAWTAASSSATARAGRPSSVWPSCSGRVLTSRAMGMSTATVMTPYQSQASLQPNRAMSPVMAMGKTMGPDASPMLAITSARVRLRENHLRMMASQTWRCSSAEPMAPTTP